ncbi:hypothetical protein, partial [Staphylococcus equorum]
VIILMMVSFYKEANRERKYLGLTLQPDKKHFEDIIDK